MIKVGITGGVGSGKTTVCKVFALLGVPVYYSDEESKKILDTDNAVKQAVLNTFGKELLDENGRINRKHLAAIVFKDKEKLQQLNSITHPAVGKHFLAWLGQHKNQPYILKEAAILFESGAASMVDKVIMVSAPQELRIQRTIKRDRVSDTLVVQRIRHQWSEEGKIARSHFVIINDEQQLIIPQVLKIHSELT